MKKLLHVLFLLVATTGALFGQVTTSSISGYVLDKNKEVLIGATVQAVHIPSGTNYGTVTNENGYYIFPAVRVGGPYTLTVSYVGYQDQKLEQVYTTLGSTANQNFDMSEDILSLGEVTVTEFRSDLFSTSRTGSNSTFGENVLKSVPVIGARSVDAITKYNPNGNGRSFGAQDSRLNNFTIDGSVFNNGFGLGSSAQAGGRTGSTAISLDAIEEISVNIAPFDVRQSGFVGAGINAVTRSGSNDFNGSVYYNLRNSDKLFIGRTAAGQTVPVGSFDESSYGFRFGGPIIKNKLFFFVNAEGLGKTEPGTSFVAEGSSNPGQTTRVLKSDLDALSSFMKSQFDYETGPYEAYNLANNSKKFLVRLDYNLNQNNKFSLRYVFHNSDAEIPISNSSSAGAGNRTRLLTSMAYFNSGYVIQDNTRSIVAEMNTTMGKKHNNLIIGYDYQNEDRAYLASFFPTVDILKDNVTYISVGFDPFTPNNKLNYGTFHITDNLSIYLNKHTITLGANFESYKSNNLFFPASNGVYIYNSLEDFYAAARSTDPISPVKANRFQFRYSALEGAADPLQILKTNRIDLYGQDQFNVSQNFNVTVGLRAGLFTFGNTALENKVISEQTYVDADDNKNYKINTGKMPGAQLLFEPRLGFNWDITGKKATQMRGGVGIFTGRPPYVWVSNQIGNNGILTGFIDVRNSDQYPFRADASGFIPSTPTLPSTYDIAATEPSYKFPQVMKTNLALDQKLPGGFVASLEFILNKNLNAVNYFNANLEPAKTNFPGVDTRAKFPGSGSSSIANDTRVNDNVSNAIVLTNTNKGSYAGGTVKIEYPGRRGFYGLVAYTYSSARDLMDAGSIASGSWTGVATVNGNNRLALSYSTNDIPHRIIGLLGYKFEYGGKLGGTLGFSLGYVGEQSARYSYTIAGDMNGDNVFNNELIFVPNKASDLKFEEYKSGEATFTVAQQEAAFEAFINQDDYLSTRRGQYAERNGAILPMLNQFDLSVTKEFFVNVGGKRNTLQLRADILNFGNLLNDNWGVGNTVVNSRILTYRRLDASSGEPVYRLVTQRLFNGQNALIQNSYVNRTSIFDVWSAQFGIRYIFGN